MSMIDERARFALLTNIYACDTFPLLGNLSIIPGSNVAYWRCLCSIRDVYRSTSLALERMFRLDVSR